MKFNSVQCALLVAVLCGCSGQGSVSDTEDSVTIREGELTVRVVKQGFRLSFPGHVEAHEQSGLVIGGTDVEEVSFGGCTAGVCLFDAAQARIRMTISELSVRLEVKPTEATSIVVRLGGASPGYGLADHAAIGRSTTDITGYENDAFASGQSFARLVSNFAIYPQQRFGLVLFDPWPKIVRSSETEIVQGSRQTEEMTDFHLFFGTPEQIYSAFHDVRNRRGYPVMKPKYEFFGVGWEAFGALGWETRQETIIENVDRYLSEGYPIRWLVVGSGHWPRHDPKFHETTSFGMYDPMLYPNPKSLIDYYQEKDILFLHGLRISFIVGGPFTEEGLANGYFLQEGGQPKVFEISWPKSPCYLLDAHNPDALRWYMNLVQKWTDYGVDGFKEDLFGFQEYRLRDDKLDPINTEHMSAGQFLMGRNGYIGSPADLHRINDFNYNQNQDRGPINSAAIAYSGFPLVYPDIVGGTFGERHFDTTPTPRMRAYIKRNAQWASVHPSMSMGQPPWSFGDPEVEEVMLGAAQLHDRLHPYFYSQAVRWYESGYPWPFAPLPIAFPNDPQAHGRENATVRGYQWMIGDALMAVPLYGDDYETAGSRDVYLPAGAWIDYDSGEKYEGPRVLESFPLPHGKTPLFIGGSGVVVEKRGTSLVVRVYPVADEAETVFWHRDGKTASRIRVDVANWDSPHVSELGGGEPVAAERKRHAWEFPLEPGVDYDVR